MQLKFSTYVDAVRESQFQIGKKKQESSQCISHVYRNALGIHLVAIKSSRLWECDFVSCIFFGVFERIPNDTKEVTEAQLADVDKLLERLEEDDDVQNVYHNMR